MSRRLRKEPGSLFSQLSLRKLISAMHIARSSLVNRVDRAPKKLVEQLDKSRGQIVLETTYV
jgi:hypothetical protein